MYKRQGHALLGAHLLHIGLLFRGIGGKGVDGHHHQMCIRDSYSTEGYDSKNWVLLDYSNVIVHVFVPNTRTYYDLEHLWACLLYTSRPAKRRRMPCATSLPRK